MINNSTKFREELLDEDVVYKGLHIKTYKADEETHNKNKIYFIENLERVLNAKY